MKNRRHQNLLRQQSTRRALKLEAMEFRRLLAADLFSELPSVSTDSLIPNAASEAAPSTLHNIDLPQDVNLDGQVTGVDALTVINLMSSSSEPLGFVGEGEDAFSFRPDVNNDGQLSADDIQSIFTHLAAEGEGNATAEFSYEIVDNDGNPIANNQVAVGDQFQLQVFVRDTRGFTATGINAAFVDIGFDNGAAFDVSVGEIQQFQFFFDELDSSQTDSTFTLTFQGQTTQPIALFDNGNPRADTNIAESIQAELEALPNVGAGNVRAIVDSVARNNDLENGVNRFSFEIRFLNDLAGQDLQPLTVDGSNVAVNAGQTWVTAINEVLDGDQSTPAAEAQAIAFDDLYNFSRLAEVTATGFNDVGAASQTIPIPNPGEAKLLFTIPMVAVAPGVINFTPTFPDNSPTTDAIAGTTTIPSDPNPGPGEPMSVVDFGMSFQVTVISDPTAPVAVDDTLNVDENGSVALNGNVTNNDTVTSPRTLSVLSAAVTGTTQGTLNGLTYIAPADFVGTDTITYVAQDSTGLSSQAATVTINVVNVNDPPVAVDDSFTNIASNSVANVLNVLTNDELGANDTGDSLTITAASTTGTGTGTVSIASGGQTLSYSPEAGFAGSETLSYTIEDAGGLSSTASVTITVQPAALPSAQIDTATTQENQFIEIDVLANDLVNTGEIATLISLSTTQQPSFGSVQIDDGGSPADLTDDRIVYTPNDNFNGTDVFAYTMNDTGGTGDNSTGTVTVTVTDINDAPVLAADSAATVEDLALTIPVSTLLANDSPGVGEDSATQNPQTLTITAVNATSAGGAVNLSGSSVIYTPTPDFNGQFTFAYTAEDSGSPALSGTATVTVSVSAVNDPPVAADDTVAGTEGQATTILLSDLLVNDSPGPVDEASQPLSISGVSATSTNGGTVSQDASTIVYTPATDFSGQDTFTYTLSDGIETATGTVTINVADVNDTPVLTDDVASGTAGTLLSIPAATLLANDSPGAGESAQTLSVTSVRNASAGSVALNGTNIEVLPPANFSGDLVFTYEATDNGSPVASAEAQVTVTVVASQNEAPIATDDQVTTDEDSPLSIAVSELLSNDSPGAGEGTQTLTLTSVDGIGLGSVTLNGSTVEYTPPADFSGTDVFTYSVEDSGDPVLSDVATVTVTVDPVNDAPVLVDDTATTTQGLALAIPISTLLANDSPGPNEADQTLSLVSVDGADVGGTVVVSGNDVVYTPAADFSGTYTFEYVAADTGSPSESATATVTIFVIASEVPPTETGVDLQVSVTESSPSVETGQTLSYQITVENIGTSSASDVVVTDVVPPELSLTEVRSSLGEASGEGNTATVRIPSLAAGESAEITVETVAVTAGTVENTVSVAASEAETVTANNSVTETTELVLALLSKRRLLASS